MYATLLSILIALFCGSPETRSVAAGWPAARQAAECVERIVSADDADDVVASDMGGSLAACIMECNCDVRVPSSGRGTTRLGDSGAGNTARSLRCAARIAPCDAASGYVAGHVTRLFEFNLYRASLRADFFLHALCRLRI